MTFRSFLIRSVTFLGGLYFVVYFLTPESLLASTGIKEAHEYISYGFVLVGSVAFGVGIINLLLIHGSIILKARKGWGYSVSLLIGLFAMMYLSCADWFGDLRIASKRSELQMLSSFAARIVSDAKSNTAGLLPLDQRQNLLKQTAQRIIDNDLEEIRDLCAGDTGDDCKQAQEALTKASSLIPDLVVQPDAQGNKEIQESIQKLETFIVPIYTSQKEHSIKTRLFSVLNEGFFIALGSSMFALLSFYITSAAYRAFRVKNLESALLLAAAVVVMLGQIPFGVKIWSGFPVVRLWLLRWPNSAAFRAISIGASVAMFVMSIRLWLSIGTQGTDE